MRSRLRALFIFLWIPMFLIYSCAPPDYGMRTQHDEVPPTAEEIKRCTTDPLKGCVPVPPEVAAKIADPNNLTAEDQKLLDELGAVSDIQLQKAINDLDKAATQFKTDIEAVQKQLGADIEISNKYHAHVDLYGGSSAPAEVPYDNVKLHGLPLKWIEDYYKKSPPMINTIDGRRRATEAEVAAMIKDLATRPDPFGMSYTKEELVALAARTTKLRGEDSKETFLGSLVFKNGDVYIVVYGKSDIVVYAKDKDIARASINNWIAPRLPTNIYKAAYQGKVGTDPGKTLDERIEQSVEWTLKNYRDMKDGEVAAIIYMIMSVVPLFATAAELDKKLCGQPGSSWLKVGGSFLMDVGFVLMFAPGRLAFGVMLGADGVAVGLLYLDGDPKNMSIIKWQAGFIALVLVFRGGAMLRAGINLLGKVPVVTTAIKSYNALLAAFKALNALLKKKCYIWPKKVGVIIPGADAGVVVVSAPADAGSGDGGTVVVATPSDAGSGDAGAGTVVVSTPSDAGSGSGDASTIAMTVPTESRITTDTMVPTTETFSSDTMDSIESAIDADFMTSIFTQSQDTVDATCDCMCTDEATTDPDHILEDALCDAEDGTCCYPDDAACLAPTAFDTARVAPIAQ